MTSPTQSPAVAGPASPVDPGGRRRRPSGLRRWFLSRRLNDPANPVARVKAVQALSVLDDPQIPRMLMDRFLREQGKNFYVLRAILAGLERAADGGAVFEGLKHQLIKHPSTEIRDDLAATLLRMGVLPSRLEDFFNDFLTNGQQNNPGRVGYVEGVLGRLHREQRAFLEGRLPPPIHRTLAAFQIDREGIQAVGDRFTQEVRRGLQGEPSSLKMLPSFIGNPEGDAVGDFVAVDFGGSELKVALVRLSPRSDAKIEKLLTVRFTEEEKRGSAEAIFGTIARQVKSLPLFAQKHYPLGFTFSFPTVIKSLGSGKLIHWTKGWDVPGVQWNDVVDLLRVALAREGGLENVEPVALTNNVVAIQLAEQGASCGFNLGTGFNISVVHPETGEILNTEAGNFDAVPEAVYSPYDQQLFEGTLPRGRQRFEKMISQQHLGEIVRLILLDAHAAGALFGGRPAPFLERVGAIDARVIARVEKSASVGALRTILQGDANLGLAAAGIDPSDDDLRVIEQVVRAVCMRAGRLIAAVVEAALGMADPERQRKHTVAVEGSVYENLDNLARYVAEGLALARTGEAENVAVRFIKNASAIGAAIAASMASRAAGRDTLDPRRGAGGTRVGWI